MVSPTGVVPAGAGAHRQGPLLVCARSTPPAGRGTAALPLGARETDAGAQE